MDLNVLSRAESFNVLSRSQPLPVFEDSASESTYGSGGKANAKGGKDQDETPRKAKLKKQLYDEAEEREREAFRKRMLTAYKKVKQRRSVLKLLQISLRAFAIGWSVRQFALVVPKLIAYLRGGQKTTIFAIIKHCLVHTLPVQWGLFLGSFVGLFSACMRIMKGRVQHPRTRAVIAGSLTGLSVLFLPDSSRTTIALFVMVRSLEILGRKAYERQLVPSFSHYDVLLMGLANAQNIWAWQHQRASLDSTYLKFLDQQGFRPNQKLASATLFRNNGVLQMSSQAYGKCQEWLAQHNFARLTAPDMPGVYCAFSHPRNASCSRELLQFWLEGLRRAAPVYLPIVIVPLILFHPKRIFTSPLATLQHCLLSIARSSVFLSTFCTSCWAWPCFVTNFAPAYANV
jgi:hypothetical protein